METNARNMVPGDDRGKLASVARFLEKRGGTKGVSKAALKGLLASLPVIGKTIEEVVYNAKDKSVTEQMETMLDQRVRDIQDTEDSVAYAVCLLGVADQLLLLAHVEDGERNRLLTETTDQLAAIEDQLERIETEQVRTRQEVSDILTILKQSPVGGEKHEALARKAIAVLVLNRQLRRIRGFWPPQPFLSRSPDTSVSVHQTLSGLRDILEQTHTIAELLWTKSDLHSFREHMERKMELALRRYETAQTAFEEDDMMKMLESMKDTPQDECVYTVVPFWMNTLEAVADVAQNEILEALKTEGQADRAPDVAGGS